MRQGEGSPTGRARRLRILGENRALDLGLGSHRSERTDSRQQLEEDHSEREDIGGGGDLGAAILLRTRIGGCQRAQTRARHLGGGGRPSRGVVQELGDPEVEQPRSAVDANQDVRRLEVPVDDRSGVGERNRFEDGEEKPHPLMEPEGFLACVVDQIRSADVLERQIPASARGPAGVVEPRDAGMFEPGQNPALLAKPALDLAHPAPLGRHDLEGDLAPESLSLLLGKVDRSHAASPELGENPERPDLSRKRLSHLRRRRQLRPGIGIERRWGAGIRDGEQAAELLAVRTSGGLQGGDETLALLGRQLHGLVVEVAQRARNAAGRPSARAHAGSRNSARIQVRANSQSRLTVAGEISRHSATSSISRPAK